MFPETMIVGERVVAVMSLISWESSRVSVLFCLPVNVIFEKVAESSDTSINRQPSLYWETSTPSSESPPSSIRRFKILPHSQRSTMMKMEDPMKLGWMEGTTFAKFGLEPQKLIVSA